MTLLLSFRFGLIAVVASLAASVHAGVMITDLGSDQYLVELEPLTFIVGSDQDAANRIVIEDFYSADATNGNSIHISGEIHWSLNGGPANAITFETNNGVLDFTDGQIDPNDLFFNFTLDYFASGASAVTAGDSVTVSTSNMIFQHPGLGLPALPGPFTAHLLNFEQSIATAGVLLGALPIAIDIKTANRDCLNQQPVTIFGDVDLDVTSINVQTLAFGGQEADGREPLCSVDYVNDDEHLDLTCKFVPGTGVATLSGELLDGSQFLGSDSICAAQ